MSSPNESNLGIRVTSTGVDESLQKLRQLHDELNRGTITTKEYRTEAREQNTLLNSNTKLWNESKAAIYAANPTLLEFSRTMSGFGQITAAATSGMTAINTGMLLLAGGSDSINQVKIKIAEMTNQLDNLEAAGQGNTTQAQNLRNTISQLNTELGNLNRQFTGQQIEAALSFGAALGQVAVGVVAAGETLGTLNKFMGEKSFFSSNIAGILGTAGALTAVAVGALVAGTALGEAFNPNKQAVSDFRAQLDASFGDNPFTNYIVFPIAAMIDDLNGAKADWNKDVSDMGRIWSDFTFQAQTDWVNFENAIIGGFNVINHARNTIFGGLDKLREVPSPADIPNIALPMQSNPNADSINKMLIGNPTTPTEQKQQLQLTTEQNRILEQTKSFGQALTSTIQSTTNPILAQSNTTLTGIYQSGQAANQLAQQQLQATQEQKATQAQLKDSLTTQIAQLKQTIADNINLPQTQLVSTHFDSDTGKPLYDSIAPTTAGQKVTDARAQIAQAQSIIQGLDNATSGLGPVLQSIGLSDATGIGSIISGALGGAAGIGGAGISAEELQRFAQTGDYGIFTAAAIRDNGLLATPTPKDQIDALLRSWKKSGLTGFTEADAAKALNLPGTGTSSGSQNIGSGAFLGLPGQYGEPQSQANILAGYISTGRRSEGNTTIHIHNNYSGTVIADNEFDNRVQESFKQSLRRAGFT